MQHERAGAQIVDHFPKAFEVRIERERDLERRPGLVEMPVPEADLSKTRDRSEMARLEFESPHDVARGIRIAVLHEGQGRPLVPGLRPVGVA